MSAHRTKRWLLGWARLAKPASGISPFRFGGSLTPSPYPLAPASPPALGFTLIEILVVLAIIGVLALAVSIGIATVGGERQLAREAERMQALVGYACTRAELSGREIGVRIDAEGYAFTMLGFDGWMADEAQGELRPRKWVRGLDVEMLRHGSPMDFANPDAEAPQIVCFSSGELSPFVLKLALGDVPAHYELSGGADGRVELQRTAMQR